MKRIFTILLIVIFLLFIPFIFMQFTYHVNWNVFDFVLAGFLLFGTGVLIDIILRKVRLKKYRLILILVVLAILLLLYMEIAIGIFSSPIAGS